MTKSDNQIIHEARGKCWHKFEEESPNSACLKCGKDVGYNLKDCATGGPFYSIDHAEYLKALLEFKEKDWWGEVVYRVNRIDCRFHYNHFNEDLLDPLTGTPILAKYLREVVKGDE